MQNLTLFMSILIDLFMRLPPDSSIPLQLLKELDTRAYVGIVLIVLSQFCTFTVFKVISVTVPSASYFGIDIQSPILNMLFAES